MRRLFEPLMPVGRFNKDDRRITITIWIAGLIQGFAQAQASATLPYTRVGLGLSQADMSLLLGFARLGGFVALPLAWMADRHGRRRPFLIAVTLIVVGGTISGLAVEAWHFGLSQAVMRIGTAAIAGLAVVILAETVSPPIRAYSISFYGAAVSLGSGVALMTLPLADGAGDAWRTPFLLVSAGFLLIPALIRRVPETRVFEKDTKHSPSWSRLVRGEWAPRFWVIISIGFLSSVFGTFGTSFATERLVNEVGLTSGTTVIILLIGGTAGGLGFFIGGHLADAWGRRLSTIIFVVTAGVGGVTLYSTTSLLLITAAMFVSSFSTFALVPSMGSHRAELFPTALRSSATTAAAHSALLGAAFGLILGIFIIDTLGLTSSVYVLSIGMAAAAILTMRLPETRGQDLTAVSSEDR